MTSTWKSMGCFFAFLFGPILTWGQTSAPTSVPAPSCVVPEDLRHEIQSRLDEKQFLGVKFDEQTTRKIAILEELIARYPREVEPQRELVELSVWIDPRRLPAAQIRFTKQEQENPSNSLALFAVGYSLVTSDAQAAIRKLKEATAVAPEYPWPYLALARLYSEGKTADTVAMAKNTERFFTLCPNVTDLTAQWLLSQAGTNELRKKVASGLREYLKKQTDPQLLRGYETLWGLEFQSHPPQEFDALRMRVGEDLKKLEGLNPKPDAEFQAFLIRGYRESGTPLATIEARENRLLKAYPRSSEAFSITHSRWEKAHKAPEDQKDVVAWANYDREWKAANKKWIQEFSDDYYLTHFAGTNMIENDDGLSREEVLRVFENDVKQAEESPYQQVWAYTNAVEFLLKHKVQPARALDVMEEAERILGQKRAWAQLNTNRTAEEIAKFEEHAGAEWWGIVSVTLEVARQLNKPELVGRMRAEVEGPAPENRKYLSWYWMNRARLARVDGRNADALTYYQLARQTAVEQPKWWRGKMHDAFNDEVKPFWYELGGSEAAWNTWTPPLTKGPELTEGRWEKPSKPLASFELVDVSGKTWRLKDLNGKVLLINLWATWCGPCQAELPHLQKLFEMTKDRRDVQVLTFNLDDDPGLIQPFLKEHGYQFPVALAYNFASAQLQEGIPQNWIVDSNGNWLWKQLGMGTTDQWEEMILTKLEGSKRAK